MNNPTVRAEEQSKIDWLYATGKIEHEEWSRRFDELSSSRWTASGPVKTEQHPENPPYKKT
jgi:hypothetical protein